MHFIFLGIHLILGNLIKFVKMKADGSESQRHTFRSTAHQQRVDPTCDSEETEDLYFKMKRDTYLTHIYVAEFQNCRHAEGLC
jgi:hypothetical protein